MTQHTHFLFAPENREWGGSEQLWSKAAICLAKDGFKVTVLLFKKCVVPSETLEQFEFNQIKILIIDEPKLSTLHKLTNRCLPYRYQLRPIDKRNLLVEKIKPKLVVVSQGFNFNGVEFMRHLKNNNINYVSISQAVNEYYWPLPELRKKMIETFDKALFNFFVSRDNLAVTELQLGYMLNNAKVISNPFQVPFKTNLPFPKSNNFALACVGRYDFNAKGQDVLLRVLMMKKWRGRPLTVHFFGQGKDLENLKDIIQNFNLNNVKVHPYTNVIDIWSEMQGLIMPSRYEGLPISLVEAMLCKRMAIVTDVSGNAEVMLHGQTGFIAEAARPLALDRAMEDAWQRRDEWEVMGVNACNHIKTLVPESPEEVFADSLIELINE